MDSLFQAMQNDVPVMVAVLGAAMTLCLRLMASDAWSPQSQMHPMLAAAIQIFAKICPDVIGALNVFQRARQAKPSNVVNIDSAKKGQP